MSDYNRAPINQSYNHKMIIILVLNWFSEKVKTLIINDPEITLE